MRPEAVETLVELNRIFYRDFAHEFAGSRYAHWDGFAPLASHLPTPCPTFLDVGCGEGRLGRYLIENDFIDHYTGVDFSAGLIAEARLRAPNIAFHVRDLVKDDALAGFGEFDGVASIAVFHHIPGFANRVRLLNEMVRCLKPNGRLIISTFQFMLSERLRRKVLDWDVVGVNSAELEPNDYLLDWKRGGTGYRYIALIDQLGVENMVAETDLRIIDQYSMDGKEGNLNLYTVLERPA